VREDRVTRQACHAVFAHSSVLLLAGGHACGGGRAHVERAVVYVTADNGGNGDLLYSMDWGSILSNRWAIEQALPRILLAADGDPATDANT
jgi:hypothetical protein